MVGYEPLGDLFHDQVTFELGSIGDLRVDISMRTAMFRGQIRDFCFSLWLESPAGRFELERVDTSDSELHRHRFYQTETKIAFACSSFIQAMSTSWTPNISYNTSI